VARYASLRWHNPGQVRRVGGINRSAVSAGLSRHPEQKFNCCAYSTTHRKRRQNAARRSASCATTPIRTFATHSRSPPFAHSRPIRGRFAFAVAPIRAFATHSRLLPRQQNSYTVRPIRGKALCYTTKDCLRMISNHTTWFHLEPTRAARGCARTAPHPQREADFDET
jgi:hypothetical protein